MQWWHVLVVLGRSAVVLLQHRCLCTALLPWFAPNLFHKTCRLLVISRVQRTLKDCIIEGARNQQVWLMGMDC